MHFSAGQVSILLFLFCFLVKQGSSATPTALVGMIFYSTSNCTGGSGGCSPCLWEGLGWSQWFDNQCAANGKWPNPYWKASKSGSQYSYSLNCSNDCTSCGVTGSTAPDTCVSTGTTSFKVLELQQGSYNISFFDNSYRCGSIPNEFDTGVYSKCVFLASINETFMFARSASYNFFHKSAFGCDLTQPYDFSLAQSGFDSGIYSPGGLGVPYCGDYSSCPWGNRSTECNLQITTIGSTSTTTQPPAPTGTSSSATIVNSLLYAFLLSAFVGTFCLH